MTRYRSPFEQYRAKLDESDPECTACGDVPSDEGWRASASGLEVRYEFVCPTCDAVETRELQLSR